jgi:hypothetical protein
MSSVHHERRASDLTAVNRASAPGQATEIIMRELLIVVTGILLASSAFATERSRQRNDRPPAQPPRQAQGNPCAAFGPGFVRVDGSATCVKLGGSIDVGVGTRR